MHYYVCFYSFYTCFSFIRVTLLQQLGRVGGETMTIYQVVYCNQFGERVADFGYYEDKLDAEKRVFEVRMKAPLESGKVCIEDVFVNDSTHFASKGSKRDETRQQRTKRCFDRYDLKEDK